MSRHAAIWASAYNVCGPRSGEAARPATVRTLATVTQLRKLLGLYLAETHAQGERALYSPAEVCEAMDALCS